MQAVREAPDVFGGARAEELRRFLRSRRARISPADVGLPTDRGRRTPGLRREDVAELAQISVGWYGQFEVGRAHGVSARTVETIGHVLRLDATEMAYLLHLTGVIAPLEPAAVTDDVAETAAERVVRTFTGGPAHIQDRYFNVLAVNDVSTALLNMHAGDNIARLIFSKRSRDTVFPEWDRVAARFVAGARVRYPAKAGDPEFEALIAELRAASPDFCRLWDAGDLGSSFGEIVRVRPPGSDVITLTWAVFPLPDTAQHVLVLSPAVDDVSLQRIDAFMKSVSANAH